MELLPTVPLSIEVLPTVTRHKPGPHAYSEVITMRYARPHAEVLLPQTKRVTSMGRGRGVFS